MKDFNVEQVKGLGAGNLFYIYCHLAQLIARMETGGSRDHHEYVDKMAYWFGDASHEEEFNALIYS